MLSPTLASLLAPPERVAAILRRAMYWLDTVGAREVLDSISPTESNYATVSRLIAQMPAELQPGLAFLLAGSPVKRETLPSLLQDFCDRSAGVFTVERPSGIVHMTPFSVYRTLGLWYLAHSPGAWSTVYYGDDSLALALRLPSGRGKALDLCAGPGIQSFICAARGWEVTSVEVNPVAVWVSQVNARLNGLTDRTQQLEGDLYSALPDDRTFSLICANPPLLPIPESVPYPFVGDGGPDGLLVTDRILRGAPKRLTPEGALHTLGMTLSDGYLPLTLDRFSLAAADTSMDLFLTGIFHFPSGADSWWCRGVAQTILETDRGEEHSALSVQLSDGYASCGASHVMTYVLTARPGTGQLIYRDLSEMSRSMWFA